MKTVLTFWLILILPFVILSQNTSRIMTHEVYEQWNKIESPQLSSSGNWAVYQLTNERGASDVHIANTRTQEQFSFERASGAEIDFGEHFVAFKVAAHPDTIKAMKRRKVKKSKLPKDTLCIFQLETKDIERIPNVESYKLSYEYPGAIAFRFENKKIKQDSTLVKDEGAENGAKLVVKNVITGKAKTFAYAKEYAWSKKNGFLVVHSTGEDSLRNDNIVLFDSELQTTKSILKSKGDYKSFVFDESGNRLAFLADRDTTDAKDKMELMTYENGQSQAKSTANSGSVFLEKNWQINEHQGPYFLEEGEKLIFGVSPIALEHDTTLLDEEKVELEIWNYKDGHLHTRQESRKKQDSKKSYKTIYDFKTKKLTQLSDQNNPELSVSKKHQGKYVLSYDNTAYKRYESWKGHDYKDIFLVDIETGKKNIIAKQAEGRPSLSPSGNYAYWYSRSDTAWYAYNIASKKLNSITSSSFYDELNDRPMHPWASGTMGWTEDEKFLVYDHYDIWAVDPQGKQAPERLTQGREEKMRYRYISLDREVLVLPSDTTVLLSTFDEKVKGSGYSYLNLKTKELEKVFHGPFRYATRLTKAKNSDDILYTKESFDIFPDLIHSDLSFQKPTKISDANPQQKNYDWGSIELYKWEDKDGIIRDALIAKPANFNPAKKYPLLVNFYEKSSDRLHRHRAPYAHRSTINYTYYTNRGYVIFNPDIHYKDGYPGESCYDAVMASVDALVDEGYIDEANMALQGHSWGGYQIAYLLTKTDRFKCAESGAPVVNMVSAYGGIRWGSGRSRMFQYERTQSRIGATLWERPDLYLYNSPIFQLDKVETPVLILHNDKDGAVPWYQGIEYFVGLRRLGKPAWLLNYNDEPHWPVKKQNRIDFNRRMEQFFDHYLLDKKMPLWMRDGIPVVKKGIIDGFELTEDEK